MTDNGICKYCGNVIHQQQDTCANCDYAYVAIWTVGTEPARSIIDKIEKERCRELAQLMMTPWKEES